MNRERHYELSTSLALDFEAYVMDQDGGFRLSSVLKGSTGYDCNHSLPRFWNAGAQQYDDHMNNKHFLFIRMVYRNAIKPTRSMSNIQTNHISVGR